MSGVVSLLNALPWFAWIVIVAIVCGTIDNVVKNRSGTASGWR